MLLTKIIPLLLIGSFLKTRKSVLAFFKGYCYTQIVFIIIVFFICITQINTFNVNTRLIVGGLNPIWIIRVSYECVLIYFIVLGERGRNLLLLILATLPILYATGSKGPFLSFLLVSSLYFISTIKKKYIYLILIVLGTSIVFISAYVSSNEESYITQRFFRAVPDGSSEEIFEESRVVVWPLTLIKMSELDFSRLLFGQGVGNFSKFYFGRESDMRYYPHNFFLELAVEQGIGLIIIFLYG